MVLRGVCFNMLYKFYGATNGESALDLLKKIIENNTLMASKPYTFNDPFEFKINLDLDADEPTKRKRFFQDNPSKTNEEYENWLQGLDQSARYVTQSSRSTLLSEFGVICLTHSYDNHLMWSHYAQNHQGFCIGFDDSIMNEIDNTTAKGDVIYHNVIPAFRFFYDHPDDFVSKTVFSKSEEWKYEQEYRIVTEKQGIVDFPMTCIKEVILGCRTFNELRNYANEQIGTKPYSFFQMVESFKQYRLDKHAIEKGVRIMSSTF